MPTSPKDNALPHALLVDLGGTSCRLGLAENGRLRANTVKTCRNSDFACLEDLLADYLDAQSAQVSEICAGVAGPVQGGTAQLTNHAWLVDGPALARALGAANTYLINDLQAQAYALDDLPEAAIKPLVAGQPDTLGPRMTFCLGTGCNIAVAHRMGVDLYVPASEAGHTTLPDAPEFRALYDHLRKDFPHLPIEAVLSGPGLSRLHAFLSGAHHPPERILGLATPDTLKLFSRLLGMSMGNLALSHLATGGVFLIGGLARAIADHLIPEEMHPLFCARGPYQPIMQRIPLYVVQDDTAALLGCARYLRQVLKVPA